MKDYVRKVLQGMIEDGIVGAEEFLGINYDNYDVSISEIQDYVDSQV
jgi:hypothetical protein